MQSPAMMHAVLYIFRAHDALDCCAPTTTESPLQDTCAVLSQTQVIIHVYTLSCAEEQQVAAGE